jgi:ADP-ribosylation factor family
MRRRQHGAADGDQEGQAEGEGNARADGVSPLCITPCPSCSLQSNLCLLLQQAAAPANGLRCRIEILALLSCSGLDNAGKTTIVKRINGEDISTVSPTLGFNIKTMEHNG